MPRGSKSFPPADPTERKVAVKFESLARFEAMRPHLPFSCSTRGWVDSQRRVKTRPSRTRSQIPHSRSLLASRVLLCRRQVLAVRVSYAATLHKTPRFGRRQRGPAILCCRPRCPAGDLPTEPWPHPPCPVPYLVSGTYTCILYRSGHSAQSNATKNVSSSRISQPKHLLCTINPPTTWKSNSWAMFPGDGRCCPTLQLSPSAGPSPHHSR